jgi:hypothetical protein
MGNPPRDSQRFALDQIHKDQSAVAPGAILFVGVGFDQFAIAHAQAIRQGGRAVACGHNDRTLHKSPVSRGIHNCNPPPTMLR